MQRLLVLTLGSMLVASPQSRPAALANGLTADLARAAASDLKTRGIPGIAVAVVNGGQVVYAHGFGVASVERHAPLTPETLFRVGSLTKMVTALAVVSEARTKHIPLDAPVGRYVGGLAPRIGSVTLAELLSHTAGFKDLVVATSISDNADEQNLLPYVRSWRDEETFFTEPGDVMSYSNLGFVLAGAVLEQVSGRPYADAVTDLVLTPVGMRHATFRTTAAIGWPFADGYSGPAGEPAQLIRPISTDARHWPAGFLWASANDYARLAIALMNGGDIDGRAALDPEVVAAIQQPRTPMPGHPDLSYGFGLVVRGDDGTRELSHNGRMDGYGGDMWMSPATNRAYVVLRNRLDTSPRQTIAALSRACGRTPDAARPPNAAAEGALRIDDLPGRYANGPRKIVISSADGGLTMTDDGVDGRARRGRLKPVAADRLDFVPADGGASATVFVVRDRNGRVKYVATGERALRRQ